MLSKLKEYDFYRRIPKDLTETTTHGSVMSLMAIVFMATLFFAELTSYLSIDYTSNVVVDPNMDNLLRINFNITLLDVPCEFAMIDVIDVLGTREDNVTKNVNKWQVDSTGLRRDFHGRNRDQIDIHHEDHHDLAQLHANGVHAVQLDEADFDAFLSGNEYTFVNFYAPWCVWCQRLEPVWEAFAEAALEENIPVSVVRVDCVKNAELCKTQKIRAFPLLRFFKKNEVMAPDYSSDRSVSGFLEFSKKKMSWSDQLKAMPAHQKLAHQEAQREEAGHPGCMMAGFLLVNRVPGNFHLEARSNVHNLNPTMANLSHVVHQLSFGTPIIKSAANQLKTLPADKFDSESMQPMNDFLFSTGKLHQAYHHYINVVSTYVDIGKATWVSRLLGATGSSLGDKNLLVYQLVRSSQVMQYTDDMIPEARFSYDLSPMSVVISKKSKKLYEFITSICAVIGGTFTVVGLLSGFLGVIFKPKKI